MGEVGTWWRGQEGRGREDEEGREGEHVSEEEERRIMK